MGNLRSKSWFFTITETATKRGTRFRNGDRPTQSTFDDLITSSVFKSDVNDRAKEDTGSFNPETTGHVVMATDSQAKSNYPKPENRTLAVQPSQLPTIDSTDTITTTSSESTLALTDESIFNIQQDDDVTTRNSNLINLTDSVKTLFQSIITYAENGINNLNTLTTTHTSSIAQNEQNITLNTQAIAALSPGGVPSIVPVGAVFQWMAQTVPTGYLVLDGSEVSQTTYPLLFAVLGTTYNNGTETSGKFRLPNMKNYSPRGFATEESIVDTTTTTTQQVFGKTYGKDAWNLDANTLPYHTHSFSATTDEKGEHRHGMFDRSNRGGHDWRVRRSDARGEDFDDTYDDTTTYAGKHTHTVSGTTGNNISEQLAQPTLSPVLLCHFIIKVD